jgi:UDPglucose--hexose-1-phosphate uridylyltransferase
MPELRFNPATRDWVIISTERAKRPEDFAAKAYAVDSDASVHCPFCAGHENKTPPEIYAIREPGTQPNTPGWKVRVTRNAFPALQPAGEPHRTKTPAGFLKMNGIGEHEVIIESPDHARIIATMETAQVEDIFLVYRARYVELAKDPRFESIILFKNHGRGAGTSLSHPHSQLIALPLFPYNMRERLDIAREHFDEQGICLYCDMINMERSEKVRIVHETDNFIAFVPYAPRMPFEMWVLSKDHGSNFENVSDESCRELARVIQTVLGKLYRAVGNPDFNFAIYSAPLRENNLEYFHWNLKIFPRVAMPAGFEIGSGMSIVSVIPEAAAEYLRKAGEYSV